MEFRLATREEREQTIENNYPEWGQPLTLAQYKEREQLLFDNCFSKLQTWVLVDTENQVILAQCETYLRPVRVFWDCGSEQVEGSGYGVASVFVPEQYRGRGYGKMMMQMLFDKIKSQECPALLSHLYSDIGPDFYSRIGWKVHSPLSLVLTTSEYHGIVDGNAALPIIQDEKVKSLIADHMHIIEQEAKQCRNYAVIVTPSFETIKWFRLRSQVFVKYLEKCKSLSDDFTSTQFPHGHFVSNGNVESWFLYFYNFKDDTLFVLEHVVHDLVAGNLLLAAAYQMAIKSGLSKVEIWNPSKQLLTDGQLGLKLETREKDSLPSLALFLDKLPGKGKNENVSWISNEKYAWV